MNLHSPYDGEIDPKWKDKIIGVRTYSTEEPIAINDSFHVAVFVLGEGNKKALFVMHHHFGMQGGCYFSPDKEPFIYSEIKVYCDWGNWRPWGDNSAFHCDFGFVTCKQDNGWKLVRITQFPACSYTVLGEGFSSAEEAMESIGVYDCEKYLRESEVIVAGDS